MTIYFKIFKKEYQIENVASPFLQQFNGDLLYLKSTGGNILNPKLKVRLKGLDDIDENNLKDTKISFEFIAEEGDRVEKLIGDD